MSDTRKLKIGENRLLKVLSVLIDQDLPKIKGLLSGGVEDYIKTREVLWEILSDKIYYNMDRMSDYICDDDEKYLSKEDAKKFILSCIINSHLYVEKE